MTKTHPPAQASDEQANFDKQLSAAMPNQIAKWRAEVARLNDLIAHASGVQASDEPMRAAFAALDARDAPFKLTLDEIGQRIGYGRAIQLLGQMWDDMMQASYPRVGRHQESMHRRSEIETIEAGEPLARLVTYYRKLGPQGRHTRLMPISEKLENVRAIERDIALYGHAPTPRATADVELDALFFAEQIVRQHYQLEIWALYDHACGQCVVGGPSVKPGFQCNYHRAKSYVAATKGAKP